MVDSGGLVLVGGQTGYDDAATPTNNLHQLGLALHPYDSGGF
jgi:hypothetical protein